MDFSICTQCGQEIDGKGIQFRGKSFCCDECCENFEDAQVDVDEPGFDELEAEELEDVVGDDELGYDSDPTEEKVRSPLDDDEFFEIDPDDF